MSSSCFTRDNRRVAYCQNGTKSKKKKEQQNQTPPTPVDKDTTYSVNLGNLILKVYQGDITAIKVDAIVNGTNIDLDLSLGAVAKAIKSKGGQELEKQLGSQRQNMKKDGIAVTSSSKSDKGLLCEKVIHIDMSGVNAANQGRFHIFADKLKDKVKQALEKADELQVKTIALPALGTSAKAKIPVSQTAEEIFKVIEKFNSKADKSINEVHVVIFQDDMLKDFLDTVKKCVTKAPKGFFGKMIDYAGYYAGYGDKPEKKSRHERHLVVAKVPVYKDQPVNVTFRILAKDKPSADNAIRLLEKSIENDIIEKSVKAKIIKDFSKDQISDIEMVEISGKVKITVDKQASEVKIRGFVQNISSAVDEVNKVIQSAERSKQTQQKAKLITDMVQWSYMEDNNGKQKLVEYPPEVNLILETALKDQKTEAFFYDSSGNKYIVDFNSYEEYPADDLNDKVKVLRKSKLVDQTFEPPSTWLTMDEKENLKIVSLKPTDKEYQDVSQKFITSAGIKPNFIKIERIQNKTLYQQFIAKKKSMDSANPPTVNNEKELWHGFAYDALNSICNYGFNRSYCGKNATRFGCGVYFAVNASYSVSDTYSAPDSNGHKRMFLCRVLTGEYCNGESRFKVPPQNPKAAGGHILYDSVTDNVGYPGMFVIFHDSQAFPEYLITFTRAK